MLETPTFVSRPVAGHSKLSIAISVSLSIQTGAASNALADLRVGETASAFDSDVTWSFRFWSLPRYTGSHSIDLFAPVVRSVVIVPHVTVVRAMFSEPIMMGFLRSGCRRGGF